MKKTILDEGNQLIVITAARGIGKTNAAATYLPPSKVSQVFWHDSEDSANNVRAGLRENGVEYGHYLNLKSRFVGRMPKDTDLLNAIHSGQLPWANNVTRNALVDYYNAVMDDLSHNLTPGKYSLYVHDTIEGLEAGMAAWVDANKRASGVTTIAYGKLWTDGVYPLYTQFLEAIHARGVQTIILTSHLKTPWEGNRPVTGKVVPSGKKILYFLSRLFVWLVKEPENANGEPAGLILKERLAKFTVDKENDEWVVRRMLPRRIPRFIWKDVRQYLINGCNLTNPPRGEVPSREEDELIEDMALTDRQMELMLLEAKKELEVVKQQSAGLFIPQAETIVTSNNVSEVEATILQLAQERNTQNPQEVKAAYLEVYKQELPLPIVIKALKAGAPA